MSSHLMLFKLKKHIYWSSTLLLLMTISSIRSAAQVQNDGTFSFFGHVGLSGTQVQGDGLGGFDKLGLMAGIGVEMDAWKHRLGFEMNLVQKGSKRDPNPEAGDREKYKMSLTYIQVPLYFNYRISEKFSALVGPAIGVLVGSKEEDLYGEYDSDPPFDPIEFSGILGAQYHLSKSFSAEVRLDQSLLPIRKKGESDVNWLIGRQYNTSLGVYLIYTIN